MSYGNHYNQPPPVGPNQSSSPFPPPGQESSPLGGPPPSGPEASGSESPGSRNGTIAAISIAATVVIIAGLAFVGFTQLNSNADGRPDATDRPGFSGRPGNGNDDDENGSGGGAPGGGGGPGGAVFSPDSLAVGLDAVWVTDSACGVVAKIDLVSQEVVGVISEGGSTSGVTIADGSVWVGNRSKSSVTRVNPESLIPETQITIQGFALGLASDDKSVWAADISEAVVHQIDQETNSITKSFPVGSNPHHVVLGGGAGWVTSSQSGTVTRIDLSDGSSEDLEVGIAPLHVHLAAESAWVTDSAASAVVRLDLATGDIIETIPVGALPHALTYVNETIWVGSDANELWRIDPATNEATAVEGARFDSVEMAVNGTDIWSADPDANEVVVIDSLSATVSSRIDMAEFGDCESFREQVPVPKEV